MIEILVGAGLAALAGAGVAAHRRWKKQHVAAWTATARAVNGEYVPAGGTFFKPTVARIEATFEHLVRVVVDHYTVSTGKSSTTYTRLAARAPGAGELQIKLRKEGVLAAVGKALGLGDLQLGDAVFDARYLVRTNDDELARVWLDATVRTALLGTSIDYTFKLEEGYVLSERLGIELDVAKLAAAMRAVAALAAGGRELVHRWRTLARELGGQISGVDDAFVPGRVRINTESDGHPVAVQTSDDPLAGTQVRRELGRRDAPRFRVEPGGTLANLPIEGSGVAGAWQALQPARLACDGESVVVSWAGYEPDLARVRQALTIVAAALTRAPVPYR